MYIISYNYNENVIKMLSVWFILLGSFISFGSASDYYVELESNSPVVRGGTVQFSANLFHKNGEIPTGDFQYAWTDNTFESNQRNFKTNVTQDTWNVTYSQEKFNAATYEIQLTVSHWVVWIYFPIASQRLQFVLTDDLNGVLDLNQDKAISTKNFISNSEPVHQLVNLSKADADYLEKNATSILTYWFIDCVYYGMTTDYKYLFNYTQAEVNHTIEALVVAGYEPITTTPPPTTSTSTTTTTKPTTTTTKTTTTAKTTTSTTTKPTTTTTLKTVEDSEDNTNGINKLRTKRDLISDGGLWMMKNGKKVPYEGPKLPFVCAFNSSTVAKDPKKTYGYFSREVTVKAPILNLNVSGNNWIQHSELLNLHVKCSGSKPFYYCVKYKKNVTNIPSNEYCPVVVPHDTCDFSFEHYYSEAKEYTVVIIVSNDISKIVNPVLVTVYKATAHAQLSVIVVPVSCCLVAVVLIVFGIAYYIQNRSRFIVEVADFNFAQQYQDLEYKTFRERLRDSLSNAFIRDSGPGPGTSDSNPWLERKYGSMT